MLSVGADQFRGIPQKKSIGVQKMNALGLAIIAVLSLVLTLAPAVILVKDRMRVTIVLSFLTILMTGKIGGLLFAIPVALFLALFAAWVRFVGRGEGVAKRASFVITIVMSVLFLAQHLVHLPLRFALDQPAILVASNVAGILLALTMLSATLEFLWNKNQNN